MKIIKKFALCALAAVLVTACIGCGKVGDFSVNKKIVCEVDGDTVTYDDYKYFFYGHYASLAESEEFSALDEQAKFEKVKAMTEDSLRRRAYIMKLVDEYEIELTDDDKDKVDYYVEQQIEQQGGEQEYKKYLVSNRVTGRVFREQIELTFFYDVKLREVLATGIDKRIDVSDAAVINDVVGGGFYRYAQIYYAGGSAQALGYAKEKIELAYEKLESGLTFAQVANAEWAGSDAEKNKYKSEWKVDVNIGAYAAKGEKEALLEDAVLALEEGQYSEIIPSGEGWHIFIRLPIDAEYVKANLHKATTGEKTMAEQSFAKRYLEYIKAGSSGIKIEYAKYFTKNVTFEMLIEEEKVKQ